ncbi:MULTISPECIES: phage tail protein [Lactobacillus]|uniref:Phage tail protein n=1 Tax=Lactobacillus xujianguonis TaxID=2495899 RepID=A0A437SXY7_9LACO|nr:MULTISPECIES: phage tail protein [Lactobacillus]RVU71781.1 phage tail protein [Lactobacillus xujianguonis]
MEVRGLNDLIVFKYDNKGVLLTDNDKGALPTNFGKDGLFRIDLQSSKGATQANFTGLNRTTTRIYGSNAAAETSTGVYQVSGTFGANDIPHDIFDSLLGLEKDKDLGFGSKVTSKTSDTYGGVIAHSFNPNVGVDLYFALPYGTLASGGDLNLGTNTENENVVHDAFTLTALARPSDGLVYEKFYSDESGFDFNKMIDFITKGTVSGASSRPSGSPTSH